MCSIKVVIYWKRKSTFAFITIFIRLYFRALTQLQDVTVKYILLLLYNSQITIQNKMAICEHMYNLHKSILYILHVLTPGFAINSSKL